MAETIRMICPSLKCRAILSVPSNARGKTVRCRQCGGNVRVPASPKAAPVPAAAAAATAEKPSESA